MRPASLPWLVGLLLAVMVGQAVAVGARLADEQSSGGRPRVHRPGGLEGGVASDDARGRLCGDRVVPSPQPQPTAGGLPEQLRPVADAVADIRGLEFQHPVNPEAVTREEISRRIRESQGQAFPAERLRSRTLAWRAMGVIPPDADLAEEIPAFSTGAIIGFYDTITKELVYVGSEDPSPFERVTLAHELTHALDDQHFNLSRLDRLDATCADDELIAGVAVAEGSAGVTELVYISRFLTDEEFADYQQESLRGGGIPEVSPFLIDLLYFPYPYGRQFVQLSIQAGSGSFDSVDTALDVLPRSTEQILHPDRFPRDAPTDVDAPDASVALDGEWTEIDVYDTGEAWLRLALALRLSDERAVAAGTGWDGGEYRAWTNEAGRIAIILDTVWDTKHEAAEFLQALRDYLAKTASGTVTFASRKGTRVVALWASDEADLDAMSAAVGP